MTFTETAFWILGPGILGVLIGSIFGHYLTKSRDLETRKSLLKKEADLRRRQFQKQILRIRYTLERTNPEPAERIFSKYAEMMPDFLSEAVLVYDDYPHREGLIRLVERAGHWRLNEAATEGMSKTKDVRDVLRDSFVELYDFTQKKEK